MTRETIDRPRFVSIHCLATLLLWWDGETSRGRRVAKLNNGTTDIWKAPSLSQQRLLKRGKVDFTVLRLFIWRTIPAQIWPPRRRRLREINKSSALGGGGFCMADGGSSDGKTVHDFRTFPR